MVAATDARSASAEELREVLDRALNEVDADQRSGPLLRAAGLSVRIEMSDIDLVVHVAASEDYDHHLHWTFADKGKPAKLTLQMDSATANAYLQGKESLAIAIARGKVRIAGDSRVALLYLPAMRLVVEPYRRLVQERYPHLALA
jgi:hypothetical protein